MKKILFSLLMLCSITAAWAEEGDDGSKEHPYSGVFNASELKTKLKVGDLLSYDCVIHDGILTVYDDRLKSTIVRNWTEWAVGDPIDDTPFGIYRVGSDYCSLNTFEARQKHTFQITGFIEKDSKEDEKERVIAITGHYSGEYVQNLDSLAAPVFNKASAYVEDSLNVNKIRVHDAKEFTDAMHKYYSDSTKIIQIMNDIDMSEYKITHSNFSAQLCGYHNMRYENGDFITDKDGNIETCTFELSGLKQPLFAECKNAKIRGLKFTEAELSDLDKIRTNVICNTATDTEFTDVAVIGCRYHDEVFLKSVPFIDMIIDFAFGNNAGLVAAKMTNCKLKKVDVIGSTLYMRGQGVGCIAGYAEKTTFEDCFVDACSTVYAEKDTKAYVGGLVGESEDCKFIRCVNMAAVCGSEKADNVGGICGKSTKCSFENCYNGGVLSQVSLETWASATVKNSYDILSALKSFYGVFSAFEEYKTCIMKVQIALSNYNASSILLLNENLGLLQIAEAAESAASLARYTSIASAVYALYSMTFKIVVAVNDPDEMGGIAASSYGSKFNRCMNAGRIYCLDAYAGGIVGTGGVGVGSSFEELVNGQGANLIPTEINNCINIGYVQGDEQTGGIVGYLEKEGRISNCLNVGTIDCNTKSTGGPIFGELDDSSYTNCYAMTHDTEDHPDGLEDGNKVFPVSYRDVMSGIVAYKLNSLSDNAYFCQDVGMQPYPTFWGSKIVTESDIRKDIDPVFKVADINAFVNAIYNQYADIELTDDIDFDGCFFSVYTENAPFRGSIDGKGNRLMHIGEAAVSGKIDGYALIKVAEGATFKNLRLDSCNIKFKKEGAGLVYTSKHCKYDNVYLSGNTSVTACPKTGGLIWESLGDSIINCGVGDHSTVSSVPLSIFIDIPATPAGGVAFKATGSTFIDCFNRGAVRTPYPYAGGIVAECEDSKFIHCVNEGSVHIENGNTYSNMFYQSGAGIAAEATNSTFYRCANHGVFPNNVKYVGGIVALGDKVTINSCLNTKSIAMLIDQDNYGGVVGGGSIIGVATNNSLVANCASGLRSTLEEPLGRFMLPIIDIGEDMDARSGNNYIRGFETGSTDGDWAMNVAQSDFDNGKVCYWLNHGQYGNDNAWQQKDNMLTLDGDGSPVTIDDIVNENRSDVFKISTAEDLTAFADHVNSGNQFACAVLMNDINMAGKKFTPIGKNEDHKHFRGIIDGRGHTIDSLKVESDQPVGLVGTSHAHAEVHNVIIGKGSEFVNTGSVNGLGDAGAGGILGRVQTGWRWGRVNIENCGSYADIKVNKHGGGIFGLTNPGEGVYLNLDVRNCFSMGTITAYNGNSALLCGYTKNSGRLYNCWSGGQLRTSQSGVKPFSTENDFGYWELLVGYDMGFTRVSNCYVIDPEHNVDLWDKNQQQGGVYTLSTTDLASGKLAYILNDSINDVSKQLVWEQNLGTDGNPTFGNKGIYHTRKVSNQYGTLCLPYYLKSNDKISYYYIAKNDIKENLVTLKFKYIDEVPPGQPILFRIKDYDETTDSELLFDWDGSNGFASTPGSYSGYWYWNMFGTYEKMVFDDTTYYPSSEVYYLSNGEIRNAKKTTIAPFRSFFWLPDLERLFPDYYESKSFAIQFILEDEDGTATALELVGEDLREIQNAEFRMQNSYNLAGQKVGDSYRGIVIKGGKKVFKK